MQERIGEIGKVWLSKRPGSGAWCRTWFDADTRQTRRTSLGTNDLQEAKVRLWEWHARYGRVGKQDPQDMPLEQVLVRYYQQHACELPSAEFSRIASGLWSDFFAGAMVSEVTPARQREFIEWLRTGGKRPRADGYIKRILTVGKAALTRAYKEGEITAAPYVIPGEDGPARERVLTVAESAALWLAIRKPHEHMMLALLFGAMARPEAAIEITREMYDAGRGLLHQNPPGRKQTKKYRPTVPVTAFLRMAIECAPDGALVRWRGQPIGSFKTAWRGIRRRAELEADVVAKTVRHTIATELRAKGAAEAEIQGFMGHKAFSGKTETYAKYRPDYLGQVVPAIDDYMERVRVNCVLGLLILANRTDLNV
jgi:integrase